MEKKEKVLFMLINMNIGGTEKALLNMIAEMPREKFEITILLLEKYGGFLNSIPSDVNVQYFRGYDKIKKHLNSPLHLTAVEFLKKGRLIKTFIFALFYIISKLKKEKSIFFNYMLKDYPIEKDEYDTAIAYAGPMDFISYFIVHKTIAKRKIQWIHFDVTKIQFNKYFATRVYKHFSDIFIVSRTGKEKLAHILPSLSGKMSVYPNKISTKLVQSMAEAGIGFEDGFTGIRILTVGRLSEEKGQDLAIRVMEKLRSKEWNVRWYCIGDGSARKEYEHLINSLHLEKDFILLGAHINPYPFMKECDIYVQPSRHEGYCITLAEARCFHHPIISTDFTGASEQLKNAETSYIVDFNEKQMFDAVCRVINNNFISAPRKECSIK
ncbi:glycosyltransferase [Bacillus niameyensis]|uniref:glycosyltransferase n=1 Tax=Bacillus niameyensis TaxID=1522308 RepID=UPI000783A3E9|nr:glycosyltransferase [Bacillus niameyensis]